MLEAGAAERDEGLENFDVFRDLLQKSERRASNVFVRMLLVESEWKIGVYALRLRTRSLRMALLRCVFSRCIAEIHTITHTTRIISCFSFPFSSYLGHTSQ